MHFVNVHYSNEVGGGGTLTEILLRLLHLALLTNRKVTGQHTSTRNVPRQLTGKTCSAVTKK